MYSKECRPFTSTCDTHLVVCVGFDIVHLLGSVLVTCQLLALQLLRLLERSGRVNADLQDRDNRKMSTEIR